jgi:hypothetical protein
VFGSRHNGFFLCRWEPTKLNECRDTILIMCWICLDSVILLTAVARWLCHPSLVLANGDGSLESGHPACLQLVYCVRKPALKLHILLDNGMFLTFVDKIIVF